MKIIDLTGSASYFFSVDCETFSGSATMKIRSGWALVATVLLMSFAPPSVDAKTKPTTSIKSCAVSHPPCYVTLRVAGPNPTKADDSLVSDQARQKGTEGAAIQPNTTDTITYGCLNVASGAITTGGPCSTAKGELEIMIIS